MKKRVLAGILLVLLLISTWSVQTFGECSHENVKIEYKEETDKSFDELIHIHTLVYSIVCEDCGIEVEKETKKETREPHQYDEDFLCAVCEYQHDGCPHVERSEGALADVKRVHDGDEKTHFTTEKYSYTCDACGVTPSDDFIVKEFREEHMFANDVCTLCGFQRDCTHEYKSEPQLIFTQYQDCDDEDHLKLEHFIIKCLKCGIVVSEYADKAGYVLEAHDFANNGLCLCGMDQKDTVCQHAERNEAASAESYERIFGDTVNHNHVTIYNEVCADCGKILKAGQTRIVPEEHSFQDGLCSACKYVEACTHSRVKKEFSRTEYRIVEGDETKHQKLDWYARTCTSCGIALRESKSSDGWQDEAHTFENGKCTLCEFTRAVCPHAQLVKAEAGNSVERIPDDRANHLHIYNYNLVCGECGQVMQTGLTDRQTEAHLMQDSTCMLCGYSESCSHGETRVGEAYNVYRVLPSGSHEVATVTPKSCGVCGVTLGVHARTSWEKELHHFRNGVCACGVRDGLTVRFPVFAVLRYGNGVTLQWKGGEGPYQLKFSVLSTAALYEASAVSTSATLGAELMSLGAHSLLITPSAGAMQKLYFVTKEPCSHGAMEVIYTDYTVVPEAGNLTHVTRHSQTLRCSGCGVVQYQSAAEGAPEAHVFTDGRCICGIAETLLVEPVMKMSAQGNLAVYEAPGVNKGYGILFRGSVARVLAESGEYSYISYVSGTETRTGYVPTALLADVAY